MKTTLRKGVYLEPELAVLEIAIEAGFGISGGIDSGDTGIGGGTVLPTAVMDDYNTTEGY